MFASRPPVSLIVTARISGFNRAPWQTEQGARFMFISTISRALSHTHGVTEDRHWWSKYIISFLLLFWFGITIILAFNLTVFGEALAGIAEVNFQLRIPLQEWVAALNLPFTALALVVLALALYLLTPENYLTIRQDLPGAVFFSGGWMTVTKLFQVYVTRYDRYNPTYLALASIIMRISGYEEWQFDRTGLIGSSKGHFDGAEYERQLQHRADGR